MKKSYNVKATAKQRKAFDNLVENGGNKSRAMIDAKYSVNTAKDPSKLTESKGFLQLCEERGLTDNLLVDSLVEDIKAKKGNRKSELELGFKIKGKTSDKEGFQGDVTINVLNYYGE